MARNTTIIKVTVGISLIILKNFADLVFVESFKAARHFPKKSLYLISATDFLKFSDKILLF